MFKPAALQMPHVPVWVTAYWPFMRLLKRATRWDGVLLRQWNTGPITPTIIREIAAFISRHRTLDTSFDICKYGLMEGKNLAQERDMVGQYQEAGATRWTEEIYSSRGTLKQIRKRITTGPPR